jgi:thiamine biosynthesis lipoprotein
MHLRDGRALGSRLRLIVPTEANATDVDSAWQGIQAAFDEVDRTMSRFRQDSELTQLNRRDGQAAQASRLLISALSLSERARRVTAGRFDPRIVADLERLGFTAVPQAWTSARPDLEPMLRVAPDGRISLPAPVDLGGLGKGIALRLARRAAAMRLAGTGFLIDAGGDIVTLGRPDTTDPASRWSIALEDESGGSVPIATCELPEAWAIATSSTRLGRRVDESGRVIHHLLDPRTREPGGGTLIAVTVAFPDPVWAEVWTKDLFLEGPQGIGPRARARGLAAWWLDAHAGLSMTPAARQLTTWVRSEPELSPRAASVAFPLPSRSPARG